MTAAAAAAAEAAYQAWQAEADRLAGLRQPYPVLGAPSQGTKDFWARAQKRVNKGQGDARDRAALRARDAYLAGQKGLLLPCPAHEQAQAQANEAYSAWQALASASAPTCCPGCGDSHNQIQDEGRGTCRACWHSYSW